MFPAAAEPTRQRVGRSLTVKWEQSRRLKANAPFSSGPIERAASAALELAASLHYITRCRTSNGNNTNNDNNYQSVSTLCRPLASGAHWSAPRDGIRARDLISLLLAILHNGMVPSYNSSLSSTNKLNENGTRNGNGNEEGNANANGNACFHLARLANVVDLEFDSIFLRLRPASPSHAHAN